MPYSKASFDRMRAAAKKVKIGQLKSEAMEAYNRYAELKAKLYEMDELAGDALHMWCEDQPL